VGVGLIAARLWLPARRAVLAALILLTATYLALAIPSVATTIINALPLVTEPTPAALRAVHVLVVFDGDNLAGRERRARRVLRQASPTDVHLLGADYLLADLRMAMKPGAVLHYDSTTWNTAAQVSRVLQISEGLPPARTAVIASRVQMPRIAALMASAGADALLVPSGLDHEPATSGFRVLLPSYSALLASRDAIYEHAALAWYRWSGDIP
jgi:hypothetical protein